VHSSFRSYSILVVEDNPGDASLIREAFTDCGKACHLHFAADTSAARTLLDAHHFDLVLSDVAFQNGEGSDFIKEIRSDSRLKTLPIIVLSNAPNARSAYEAGANAFVAKSADLSGFVSKIKALMHFWVDVVELPRLVGPD
jgi:CheY-like chemotaxis protein